jgi:hypothetical protein
MGIGEPLHNYDATTRRAQILADDRGFAIHPAHHRVDGGLVPAIERLAAEDVMPRLQASLHAPTDEQRARLVPVNRKYPIAEIIEACRRFPPARRGRITFEYVLLAGVNDTSDDARRLAALVKGLHVKVNLIPLNPAAGIPFDRPSDARIDAFGRALAERGVTVMVRKSRGRDIRAACGQLAVEGMRKSAAQRLADAIVAAAAPPGRAANRSARRTNASPGCCRRQAGPHFVTPPGSRPLRGVCRESVIGLLAWIAARPADAAQSESESAYAIRPERTGESVSMRTRAMFRGSPGNRDLRSCRSAWPSQHQVSPAGCCQPERTAC